MFTQDQQKEGGKMPMTDKWSGLADFLANMIEKYAVELDIDALPDPVVERTDERIDKDNRIRENVIETQKAA